MEKKNKNSVTVKGRFPGKIQNRYLDMSILLKETGSNHAVKSTVYIIGLFVLFFLIWANTLEITEVASTIGEITHQGDVIEIQHLLGGIIKKIYVKNGTFVKSGDKLASLDPLIPMLELESVNSRKKLLLAKKIRLEALISGIKPDFSVVKEDDIRNSQELLYKNTLKSYDLEKNIIRKRINQIKNEIDIQKSERIRLIKALTLIKEELEIRKKLQSRGLNSRVTLLRLEKEYSDALFKTIQFPDVLEKLNEKRKEMNSSLSNITATYMEKYSRELEQISFDFVSVYKQINMYDINIDSLDLKAPQDGIVHDLKINAIGQITRPGFILLKLVPTNKPLVAKVKILPTDVGHIKKGQSVIMRITTYDSRRYGVVKGTVDSISPSVIIPTDKNEPYYEGIIKLNRDYIGKDANRLNLFSGMSLTADIRTGSKYFIEYLLKPVYTSTRTSFHER